MNKRTHKTAILVFANSAKEELLRKPLPKGEMLFETLSKETLHKVEKTGLPFFHITEREQKGASFGERFVNAIECVLSQGFENIITIGNDTPQLRTQHILKAESELRAGKTVLGPSLDGGFYLMGIHKSNFDSEIFKRLPWQRFSLFQRISALLNHTNNTLHRLPVLNDIDTIKDVERLASYKKHISTTVLKLLLLLTQLKKEITSDFSSLFSTILLQRPFNKGSPLVLHP